MRLIAPNCATGQLGACAGIETGQIRCPAAHLSQLFHAPSPIIYPAVAGLVSRLPCPTLVVTFYAQLQETRGLVSVIEANAPVGEIVASGHIQVLVDLLINQCILAKMILSNAEPKADREAALLTAQRAHMLKVLDEQLASAKQMFPNADSFHGRP